MLADRDDFGCIVLGVLILAVLFALPFAFAWSVNTIFGTDIVVTWKVWLAIMVLLFVANAGGASGGHSVK